MAEKKKAAPLTFDRVAENLALSLRSNGQVANVTVIQTQGTRTPRAYFTVVLMDGSVFRVNVQRMFQAA